MMKVQLRVRPDLKCSICNAPITDVKTAHLFWRTRIAGIPLAVVVHGESCDTAEVWRRYGEWENLARILHGQDQMRMYFNSQLFQKQFSRRELKEGLEQIFLSVPDEFFSVSQEEMRQYARSL